MDWVLKAQEAAQKKAFELQEQASQSFEQASKLAQDVIGQAACPNVEGSKDFLFDAGPLGFTLDGMVVDSVTPNSQAARHGLEVGDRILAIAAYAVPAPRSATDTGGAQKAARLVKQWMKETPRPCTYTFLPKAVAEAAAAESTQVQADSAGPVLDVGSAGTQGVEAQACVGLPGGDSSALLAEDDPHAHSGDEASALRAELRAERQRAAQIQGELMLLQDENRSLQRELADVRAQTGDAITHSDDDTDMAQLRLETQVRKLQEQVTIERGNYDSVRKQVAELQLQLSAANGRCDDLRTAVANSEEVAREGYEGRERVLEEEVGRLRSALSETEARSQAAVRAAEEAAEKMVAAVEERISELEVALARRAQDASEADAKRLASEFAAEQAAHRLMEDHAAELERLRAEHEQQLRELGRQERMIACDLERAQKRLEQTKQDLEKALQSLEKAERKNAEDHHDNEEEGSADEADTGGDALASVRVVSSGAEETAQVSDQPPEGPSPETSDLLKRIAYLEGRCTKLQKQLSSRPIVCQTYQAGDKGPQAPSMAAAIPWEPFLRAHLGPRASALVVRVYGIPDRALRRFSELLVKNSIGMWLFYIHLLFLYLVVSSCSSQKNSTPAGPAHLLGKSIEQDTQVPR